MRRILSILLTLVVGFGPAIAAVPANALASGYSPWTGQQDESRLPACCRKHGAHHCAMSMGIAGNIRETTISATGCCPCWPHVIASTATSAATLGTPRNPLPIAIETHAAHQALLAAFVSERRTWPKRGPPSQQGI